jgi:biopolymer transport protein ExbB/TolQ
MIPAILKGATPLATARRFAGAALLLIVVAVLAWSLITGRFWQWRADVWKGRAQEATQAAEQAQAKADSADAGAANATETRQEMDAALDKTRTETKSSVERIKNHAPVAEPVPDASLDAGILRELEEGDRAYRAAADRLQFKGAR